MGGGEINVTPEFCLAGEATFTVSNGADKHFTFHIFKKEAEGKFTKSVWFIKVLRGPDNINSYAYMGMLELPVDGNINEPKIKLTAKTKFGANSAALKVARWALRTIWQVKQGRYQMPAGYSIKHIGKCGRCGHPLTTPESIDTGLGPICAELAGVEWRERTRQQGSLLGEGDNVQNQTQGQDNSSAAN